MMFYILVAISLFGSNVFGQDSKTLLSASEYIVIGKGHIQLRCNLTSATGITEVSSIQLSRNSTASLGSPESRIVSVDYNRVDDESLLTWQDDALKARGAVFGNVDTPATAHLELNINQPECNDGATYQCTITFTSGGSVSNNDDAKTVMVAPDKVPTLTVVATDGSILSSGEVTIETVLYLTCSGSVGRPAGNFRWCRRLEGGEFMEVTSDLNDTEAVANDDCQFERSSFLLYNVSAADTQTTIRCEVNGSYTCGSALYNTGLGITTHKGRSGARSYGSNFAELVVLLIAAILLIV